MNSVISMHLSLFGDGHLKKKDLCVSNDKAENENLILIIRSSDFIADVGLQPDQPNAYRDLLHSKLKIQKLKEVPK